MTFVRQIVSGVKWSAASRYGDHFIAFVTTAILARLLSAEAFGLLALAALVIGFLVTIADLGTATALIQRESVSRSLESTVFWANLVIGAALAGVAWIAAPAAAIFFQNTEVAEVLRVLSVSLIFSAAGAVPTALLSRDMAFDKLGRVQLLSAAVSGGIGVGMALSGWGVWSLVAQHLARTFLEAVGVLWVAAFRPAAIVSRADLLSVASFGINLSGFHVVNFVTRNIDNLLIGRFLGATALGYYDIAWRLIEYPKTALAGVIGRVMVPAYARLQSDHERFGRAYLRIISAIALLSMPLMLGMMLVAHPLVVVVFGETWLPSADLVFILALVGLAQSLGATTGGVYVAKDRTGWLFAWSLLAAAGTTAGAAIGLVWGLVGVAAGRLVANTALFPVNMGVSLRLIDLRLPDLARSLRPLVGASLIMVAVVVLLRIGLRACGVVTPIPHLLTSAAIGAATYAGAIWWIRPPILHEILATLSMAGAEWATPWMVRFRPAEE